MKTKKIIALASDHAGFALKNDILSFLKELRFQTLDFGCGPEDRVNYVLYAEKAAKAVQEGSCDLAILFCGTGLGMAMVANKFKGLRAVPCWDEYTARMSRAHNDANCLALGGRVTSHTLARSIVRTWLETGFEGGRHRERLNTLRALEEKTCRAPKIS